MNDNTAHNSASKAGTRLTRGNFLSSNWINLEQLHEIDAADEEDSLIKILQKLAFLRPQDNTGMMKDKLSNVHKN